MKIVSIVGKKNTGKTSLTVKVIEELTKKVPRHILVKSACEALDIRAQQYYSIHNLSQVVHQYEDNDDSPLTAEELSLLVGSLAKMSDDELGVGEWETRRLLEYITHKTCHPTTPDLVPGDRNAYLSTRPTFEITQAQFDLLVQKSIVAGAKANELLDDPRWSIEKAHDAFSKTKKAAFYDSPSFGADEVRQVLDKQRELDPEYSIEELNRVYIQHYCCDLLEKRNADMAKKLDKNNCKSIEESNKSEGDTPWHESLAEELESTASNCDKPTEPLTFQKAILYRGEECVDLTRQFHNRFRDEPDSAVMMLEAYLLHGIPLNDALA